MIQGFRTLMGWSGKPRIEDQRRNCTQESRFEVIEKCASNREHTQLHSCTRALEQSQNKPAVRNFVRLRFVSILLNNGRTVIALL